eukprot:gene22358-biopygen7199
MNGNCGKQNQRNSHHTMTGWRSCGCMFPMHLHRDVDEQGRGRRRGTDIWPGSRSFEPHSTASPPGWVLGRPCTHPLQNPHNPGKYPTKYLCLTMFPAEIPGIMGRVRFFKCYCAGGVRSFNSYRPGRVRCCSSMFLMSKAGSGRNDTGRLRPAHRSQCGARAGFRARAAHRHSRSAIGALPWYPGSCPTIPREAHHAKGGTRDSRCGKPALLPTARCPATTRLPLSARARGRGSASAGPIAPSSTTAGAARRCCSRTVRLGKIQNGDGSLRDTFALFVGRSVGLLLGHEHVRNTGGVMTLAMGVALPLLLLLRVAFRGRPPSAGA